MSENETIPVKKYFIAVGQRLKSVWQTITTWASRRRKSATMELKHAANGIANRQPTVSTVLALVIIAVAIVAILPHLYFDRAGFQAMVSKISRTARQMAPTLLATIATYWKQVRSVDEGSDASAILAVAPGTPLVSENETGGRTEALP